MCRGENRGNRESSMRSGGFCLLDLAFDLSPCVRRAVSHIFEFSASSSPVEDEAELAAFLDESCFFVGVELDYQRISSARGAKHLKAILIHISTVSQKVDDSFIRCLIPRFDVPAGFLIFRHDYSPLERKVFIRCADNRGAIIDTKEKRVFCKLPAFPTQSGRWMPRPWRDCCFLNSLCLLRKQGRFFPFGTNL